MGYVWVLVLGSFGFVVWFVVVLGFFIFRKKNIDFLNFGSLLKNLKLRIYFKFGYG